MPSRHIAVGSALACATATVGLFHVRGNADARPAAASAPPLIPACHLRLPPPLPGEPRFALPAGGRATLRALAGGLVLCTLFRADRTRLAHAYLDRLGNVLEIRFFRTSGTLLFAVDGAYPAFGRAQGAQVSCGSPAYRSIGDHFWREPIRWRLGKAPEELDRRQVVGALTRAHSEWTNNVNWCSYRDHADGSALYEGPTSHRFGQHDGLSTVEWGSLTNVQNCSSALACTDSWYDARGNPRESDTRFNEAYPWFAGGGGRGYDIQSIAAHEFGHARQFDHVTAAHTRAYTDLMWPYLTRRNTSGRRLGRGDSLADNMHY
jgi:hypothetical protein